jgi:hypothetical protein
VILLIFNHLIVTIESIMVCNKKYIDSISQCRLKLILYAYAAIKWDEGGGASIIRIIVMTVKLGPQSISRIQTPNKS